MSNFKNSTSPAMITFGESSLKRSRGRPVGSKNKPKKDAIHNVSPTPITNKIILEVPPRVNIIQWVAGFAQQNGVSLAILSGSGSISEVNLKHMGSQLSSQVFIEELNLVSFSGAYLISPSVKGSSTTNFFNALLVRKNGSVVGGSAWRMLAFGPVILSVLIFSDPHFYKIETIA